MVLMFAKVVMVVVMMAMEMESEVMMEMMNKKRPFDSHFIDLLTIFVRSIIPPQTPGDLLRLLSTLLLGQVGSSLTFFITNQIKSKRIRTSRFRPSGMAVLNGKPTVMGGYEKGATPRDQDRVTFGIKGSELDTSTKDGPGHTLKSIALDPLVSFLNSFGCPCDTESPRSLIRSS